MKLRFVFLAIACVTISLVSSCGKKAPKDITEGAVTYSSEDKLATLLVDALADTLNPVRSLFGEDLEYIKSDKALPYVAGFDEEYFCYSAKKMLDNPALCDSASYLVGLQIGSTMYYQQKQTIDMNRLEKAVADFKKVDVEDFTAAIRSNFLGEEAEAVNANFEINPSELEPVAIKFNELLRSEEEVSPSLRDSASYLFGLMYAYNMVSSKLNIDTVVSSAKEFMAIERDSLLIKSSQAGFQNEEYPEYAALFKIAPDKLQDVYGRYMRLPQEAMVQNVKVQSLLFVKKVAARNDFQSVPVEYEIAPDSTATANIYVRFLEKTAIEDSPIVEYGDSMDVHYTGRHVDFNTFDSGEFPVDGLKEQGLIKGFTAALLMLHEGDEVEVVIPYQLGYGEHGQPSWFGGYNIYPCETLVFTLSISDLRKMVEAPEAEAEELEVEE